GLGIGLGNIGLAPTRTTAGVWASFDGGQTWTQVLGGDNPSIPNNTIPSGVGVGRVTVAQGQGRTNDDAYLYVLVANPPPAVIPGNFDVGTFQGLYRSKDSMLNFTKVMLKQEIGRNNAENYVNINLLGREASNVGALIVDPTDPNVVYVGGSRRWEQINDPPTHGFIRVGTGNRRDTTYVIPFNRRND